MADWYPKVLKGGAESRLVIADSGSTDRTHVILEELQKKYCQIEILSQTKKEHGAKLMALYAYAVGQGADYIFQTDSDGQTRAEEFETFWQLKDRYEAVLGMRKKRGDGFSRMFVEKTLCRILRVCFGVVIPDANAPFRLMRASLVQKYLCRLPED